MTHSPTIVYNFLYKNDSLTHYSVQLSVQKWLSHTIDIVYNFLYKNDSLTHYSVHLSVQ
jgi:hypothetical protein